MDHSALYESDISDLDIALCDGYASDGTRWTKYIAILCQVSSHLDPHTVGKFIHILVVDAQISQECTLGRKVHIPGDI